MLSREPDGAFNEDYCKWCYADGQFAYQDLQTLTDFLVEHMSNENWSAEQARAYFEAQLPQLQHWREKRKNKENRALADKMRRLGCFYGCFGSGQLTRSACGKARRSARLGCTSTGVLQADSICTSPALSP